MYSDGINETFKVTGYSKVLFDLDSLTIFDNKNPERYHQGLEEYHKDIYKKLVRESDRTFSIDSSTK